MFEVSMEHTFAAGHALRHYKGKCENVHGHNYRVQVIVRGEKLDQTGMLADFVELKRLLRGYRRAARPCFSERHRAVHDGESIGREYRGLYLRKDAAGD